VKLFCENFSCNFSLVLGLYKYICNIAKIMGPATREPLRSGLVEERIKEAASANTPGDSSMADAVDGPQHCWASPPSAPLTK
jgi:hypothetical protein